MFQLYEVLEGKTSGHYESVSVQRVEPRAQGEKKTAHVNANALLSALYPDGGHSRASALPEADGDDDGSRCEKKED